jgi:hypothetical protein
MRLLLPVTLALLAAPVGLLPAQGARPMGRWDREVAAQLARAARPLEEQGFTRRSEPQLGLLNHGETDSLTIGLREGGEYALVGVCDSACSDMDLRLFDESSHEVQVALGPGQPVLQLKAPRTSKYRLRVVMTACSHSPCRYSVAVFQR